MEQDSDLVMARLSEEKGENGLRILSVAMMALPTASLKFTFGLLLDERKF